jgi:hypothetical protein
VGAIKTHIKLARTSRFACCAYGRYESLMLIKIRST